MSEDWAVWIKKIKEGDKQAFEKLFLRYYDPLCGFCWRFTRSGHVSEEVVQEVFLVVWESREALDPQKNIRSYLYQSVKNKALNYLKHKEVAEEYNPKIEWLQSSQPASTYAYKEQSAFVKAAQKAIEELPKRARRIYKLSRKDGLTYREIAAVLDISPKTVESQMSRALKILRKALSSYI